MARTRICVAVLVAGSFLGGCATSPLDGRPQPGVPKPVSAVYSQMNMKLRLLSTRDAPKRVVEGDFDQRVARIGQQVAEAAFRTYPEFGCQVERLDFTIVDKSDPGTLSTALGRIIVLRPVEGYAPTDLALAFIIAREIGHVVAQHHEENAAVGLFISGLAHVLLPVATIAKAITDMFIPGAGAATASATAAASASVTATSYVGSQKVLAAKGSGQQDEADEIAFKILAGMGHAARAVEASFAAVDLRGPVTEWAAGLQYSVERIAKRPAEDPRFVLASRAEQAQNPPACRDQDQPMPVLGMLR